MDHISSCRSEVFKQLWDHYFRLVPFAPQLVEAFKARQDEWLEDHVAYRTLPGDHTGSHVLQGVFEALGYTRKDDYHFEAKQLKAFWMCPPNVQGHSREASPKIFISELMPSTFSPEFQETLRRLSSQVVASPLKRIQAFAEKAKMGHVEAGRSLVQECAKLLTSLPPWSRPSLSDYEVLKRESEYASWTLLYGNQINHFTVSVHLMKSFKNIQTLAAYLENDLKVPMNNVGGVVKGTAELQLEQIATMAADFDYAFQEGVERVPYGFVEFAQRYPLPGRKSDGQWSSYYQGFVTSNADKIFESTFR